MRYTLEIAFKGKYKKKNSLFFVLQVASKTQLESIYQIGNTHFKIV